MIKDITTLEKKLSKKANFGDNIESRKRHPMAAPAVIFQKHFFKPSTIATNHRIKKFITMFIKKTKSRYNIIATPD